MGTETVDGAAAYARMSGPYPRRMCLAAVADAYGYESSDRPGYYQSADLARDATPGGNRHYDRNIPLGAVVFFHGNHVAISGGGDIIRSTDAHEDGMIGQTTIAAMEDKWPDISFAFWADWVCGHPITVSYPTSPSADAPGTYTVQTGDSLSSIAAKFGLPSWIVLYDANRDKIENPDLIYSGQVLALPIGGAPLRTYTVQSGDSLSAIADKFPEASVTWETIWNANREIVSDPNLIYVGQVLKIPA